jgi:hypothetical protein
MPKKPSKPKLPQKTYSLCAIGIPDNCPIIRTPRTDAKSLSLPFSFPDGSQGILTVTKVMHTVGWNPRDDLEKVVLTFNDKQNA